MATGDDALAAGMDLVNGASTLANTLDTEVNKTRDYIAQRTNSVTPVAKGGTGATNATAARANLGAPQAGTVGGRAVMDVDGAGNIGLRFGGTRFIGRGGASEFELANFIDVLGANANANSRMPIAGGTFGGDIYLPASSAATSGWTAAYINSDGRVCRGASSLRYKKHVSEVQPSAFGNIFPPLNRFQMRGGDGRWTFGHIAETLAEDPDTEPFVMYDAEGRPDSVDYIPLLLAKVEQLNARIAALEGAP